MAEKKAKKQKATVSKARSKVIQESCTSNTPDTHGRLPLVTIEEFMNKPYDDEEPWEDVPIHHIALRDLLEEKVKDWYDDFMEKAGLTTNMEEFINRNLSIYGIHYMQHSHYSFNSNDYGINIYVGRGYACAVKGENPYMDEIKVAGPQTAMISRNLFAFIDGYYQSLLDSLVFKFKKETPASGGDYRMQSRPPSFNKLRDVFINDEAYHECFSALQKVDPPIVSEDNRYLLGSKQKAALSAWYAVLKLREKLKPGVTAAKLTELLNLKIEGLLLYKDGSTLNRTHQTMYNWYYNPLSKLII